MKHFLMMLKVHIACGMFRHLNRMGLIFWGSGGGDAPSPDPQIGQAALRNAQLGQDAFEFYKQEYINAKPAQEKLNALSAEVQQQLLESGKINNQIAADYQQYQEEVFRPLEKSIVENANNYDTAGRREQEAALGLADVTQTFDSQREKTNRNNERMGINPNSGNAQAVNAQLDVAEAVAGANAMNKGRKNAETMGNAMKLDAASLGRGLASNQATSQQIANNSATSAVNTGLSVMQNDRAQTGVMGSGYSTAMQGNNSAANILTNQYQAESQAYRQQQANNAQGWAGLGTLAGVGLMAFPSDENLKKDITPYSDDDALNGIQKIEISKWKYDGEKFPGADEQTHIGAMAQDMNKNLGAEVSDGKKVDIISAIGLNMAATKALANKIDDIVKNKVHEGPGVVKGKATGKGDTVAAKLRPKEFVLNAEATKMIGLDTLNAVNKAGLKKREGATK